MSDEYRVKTEWLCRESSSFIGQRHMRSVDYIEQSNFKYTAMITIAKLTGWDLDWSWCGSSIIANQYCIRIHNVHDCFRSSRYCAVNNGENQSLGETSRGCQGTRGDSGPPGAGQKYGWNSVAEGRQQWWLLNHFVRIRRGVFFNVATNAGCYGSCRA